jgi:peptidyl-prolyl cis-trans isomerase SurA
MSGFRLARVLALIFGLVILLAAPAAPEVVDRIVAVVNDQVVTLSELQQTSKAMQAQAGLKPQLKEDKAFQRQMLESLIDRKLAQEEAKRRGITVSDRELEKALQDFKQMNRVTDDAALAEALSKAGLTLRELKQQIGDQILHERLLQIEVGGKVSVSDAEVHRFYEEHAQKGGTAVHLRLITLPFPPGASPGEKEEVQKKAEVILEELRQKVPFEEVIRRHGVRGEDLGYIAKADLDPRLGEYLERLKPGEVGPIQTPGGFQLVQLVGKRAGQPRSFEETAPEIRRLLMQREMEKRFREWIKTLWDKAHIKIML